MDRDFSKSELYHLFNIILEKENLRPIVFFQLMSWLKETSLSGHSPPQEKSDNVIKLFNNKAINDESSMQVREILDTIRIDIGGDIKLAQLVSDTYNVELCPIHRREIS